MTNFSGMMVPETYQDESINLSGISENSVSSTIKVMQEKMLSAVNGDSVLEFS